MSRSVVITPLDGGGGECAIGPGATNCRPATVFEVTAQQDRIGMCDYICAAHLPEAVGSLRPWLTGQWPALPGWLTS